MIDEYVKFTPVEKLTIAVAEDNRNKF